MTNNAPHTPARTVAITGGARGIGYQTAKELIRRGHRVAIGDIDEAVFESSSHWYSPTVGAKLLDYTSFPDVDVRVHRRFDDDALWDYLSSIDVSVLPYRFGTHSGWLEACRDLGTSVVASDCGFYADQARVHSFRMGIDSFDPDTLVAAVRASHADRTPAVDSDVRAEQRQRIAATHAAIYSAVTKEMR